MPLARKQSLLRDGSRDLEADLDFGGFTGVNIKSPALSGDLVTKGHLDAATSNLSIATQLGWADDVSEQSGSGSITLDLNDGLDQVVDMTGAVTMTISNFVVGMSGNVRLDNDTAGSLSATFSVSGYTFKGDRPTSVAANSRSKIYFEVEDLGDANPVIRTEIRYVDEAI